MIRKIKNKEINFRKNSEGGGGGESSSPNRFFKT